MKACIFQNCHGQPYTLLLLLSLTIPGLPCSTSFSLVVESGSSALAVVQGLLLAWFFLLWSLGSRMCVLQQLQCVGSGVTAPGLQSTGSVIKTHGHRGFVACGIFLDQGLKLCFLALAGMVFTTEQPGKPIPLFLYMNLIILLSYQYIKVTH